MQDAYFNKEIMPTQAFPRSAQVEMSLAVIRIFALGRPAVLVNGKPIEHWRMARAMELFYFLLTTKQPISKEEIITELWLEYDEQTKQTFHSTLHYLRKLLGKSCLLFHSGGYMLNLAACYGDSVWYDVWEFQVQYKRATQFLANREIKDAKEAFLAMIAIYEGDYGQPFYNDWCTHMRDELRILYMEALHKLALIAWREEAFDESLKYWRSMLRVDNCLEEAHYGIMRCYIRQNKRSAALRQYHKCREILQLELNIEPAINAQNLYQKMIRASEAISSKVSHSQ